MKIYYIGGSPCSGKTTIAEMLAKEYGLFHFEVDDSLGRYAAMGAKKGYPACKVQWKGTPDEIWLRDPALQCEQELQFYREIFTFIQEDIRTVSQGQDMIVEGAALLPELMKMIGILQEKYLCITPTKNFQTKHYKKREWVPIILEGCSDKEKAFANWMERDVLFAENVRTQCKVAGYISIVITGQNDIFDMKEKVCEQLNIVQERKV